MNDTTRTTCTRLAAAAALAFLAAPAAAGQVAAAPVVADTAPRADAPRVRVKSMVLPFGDDRAYLGVQIEEDADHPDGGARVTGVVPDGPAERAGLREGDVIVRFAGDVIRGPARLTKVIHAREPGESVAVAVRRAGETLTLDVELGDRSGSWARLYEPLGDMMFPLPDPPDVPDAPELLFEPSDAPFGGAYTLFDCEDGDCPDFRFFSGLGQKAILGVELTETTPELREHLGGTSEAGVLVGKVLSGMPAESAGIEVGDLILRVAGHPVANARQLRLALQDTIGTTFDVDVVRDRAPVKLTVTIPQPTRERPTGPRAALAPAPPPRPAPPSPPAAPPAGRTIVER